MVNFQQNVDFERSQFKRMGVALTEFNLFRQRSLPVLAEGCFKSLKFTFDEYFNY